MPDLEDPNLSEAGAIFGVSCFLLTWVMLGQGDNLVLATKYGGLISLCFTFGFCVRAVRRGVLQGLPFWPHAPGPRRRRNLRFARHLQASGRRCLVRPGTVRPVGLPAVAGHPAAAVRPRLSQAAPIPAPAPDRPRPVSSTQENLICATQHPPATSHRCLEQAWSGVWNGSILLHSYRSAGPAVSAGWAFSASCFR